MMKVKMKKVNQIHFVRTPWRTTSGNGRSSSSITSQGKRTRSRTLC